MWNLSNWILWNISIFINLHSREIFYSKLLIKFISILKIKIYGRSTILIDTNFWLIRKKTRLKRIIRKFYFWVINWKFIFLLGHKMMIICWFMLNFNIILIYINRSFFNKRLRMRVICWLFIISVRNTNKFFISRYVRFEMF